VKSLSHFDCQFTNPRAPLTEVSQLLLDQKAVGDMFINILQLRSWAERTIITDIDINIEMNKVKKEH